MKRQKTKKKKKSTKTKNDKVIEENIYKDKIKINKDKMIIRIKGYKNKEI